jgi:hypothetical protein
MPKSKSLFVLDCLISVNQDTFMGYSLESFITGITNSHSNQINELKSNGVFLIDNYKFLKGTQ